MKGLGLASGVFATLLGASAFGLTPSEAPGGAQSEAPGGARSEAPGGARSGVPDGKWWKRPRIAAEIGLTPEQTRQIEKIFVRTRSRLIDLKADLEKKQLSLSSAMDDRETDRREVERRIEAVENARAELQKARALMVLDMKQVLKAEQLDRLLERQQQRRERRRLMRDSFRPRPGDDGENRRTPRGRRSG